MSSAFEHVFPAIRGTQAGRDIFVSLCPLQLAAKLFLFAEELVPEIIRRNRVLHQETVTRITKYLVGNPANYVLPPLLVSIDSDPHFDALQPDGELGYLHIPMAARLIVNGGEHERAAIEKAIAQQPKLAGEKIPVVFQPDRSLKRAAKIYTDLKMFSTRPSASLKLLHSVDDDTVRLTRELVDRAKPFPGLVEMKRSALAPRSKMLFTLSAIYQATKALLNGTEDSYEKRLNLAIQFWNVVDAQFPEWHLVRTDEMLPSQVRAKFLHSHGLALLAIGKTGNTLLQVHPEDWEKQLKLLRNIDWRRTNAKDWEGRAFVGGKVSKASANVMLTTTFIKKALGLSLSPSETAAERALKAGKARR
jgi:DNA sulfur modification protein DndB